MADTITPELTNIDVGKPKEQFLVRPDYRTEGKKRQVVDQAKHIDQPIRSIHAAHHPGTDRVAVVGAGARLEIRQYRKSAESMRDAGIIVPASLVRRIVFR